FASAPQDYGVCPRDSVQLEVTGGTYFKWTPKEYLTSDSDAIVYSYPPGPLVYTVYVTNEFTCRDTVIVPVKTYPAAVLYLGEDVYLRPGERYQMDAKGNCVTFS